MEFVRVAIVCFKGKKIHLIKFAVNLFPEIPVNILLIRNFYSEQLINYKVSYLGSLWRGSTFWVNWRSIKDIYVDYLILKKRGNKILIFVKNKMILCFYFTAGGLSGIGVCKFESLHTPVCVICVFILLSNAAPSVCLCK